MTSTYLATTGSGSPLLTRTVPEEACGNTSFESESPINILFKNLAEDYLLHISEKLKEKRKLSFKKMIHMEELQDNYVKAIR